MSTARRVSDGAPEVAELARKARVAPNTIVRIESGRKVSPNSLAAVRGALEASGIEFLERGVKLRDAGGELPLCDTAVPAETRSLRCGRPRSRVHARAIS